MIIRILRDLMGLPLLILIASYIICLNALQMVSMVFIPFSPRLFHRINSSIAAAWWRVVIFGVRYTQWIKIELHGHQIEPDENAIVMMNHQGMADIPAVLPAVEAGQRFGHLKWFAKHSLRYLPGPGWGLVFLGSIFVKRQWARDASSIEATFAHLKNTGSRFWLMCFVEGTRFSASKLAHSQEICRRKKRPVLQHLLAPRTRGLKASVRGLQDTAQAVYDLTVFFHGGRPSLWAFFRGRCRKIEIHVHRTPMGEVPQQDSELEDWIWQAFARKDALLTRLMTQEAGQ